MHNYFIYQYNFTDKNEREETIPVSTTVIFCEPEEIKISTLQSEIQGFYEKHSQTDKIFVFGGEYLRKQIIDAFITKEDETFRYLPKFDLNHLHENLHLYSFDEMGEISSIGTPYKNPEIFKAMFNHGMVKIFLDRGGLIESKEAHHFVFPSGKHSNKFLRTGNILLYSSEIYFIAFQLLSSLDPKRDDQIYCDTSSINSLAFALQDLKRRIMLTKSSIYKMLPVESFSSYEGLYKGNAIELPNCLILISASTSGKIISRIISAHPIVRKSNIKILYFLGPEESYRENSEQIICNLTRTDENLIGVELYKTFIESDCSLCENGSHAVKINGDVFLSENPKINRVTLRKSDAPKFLSPFVNLFMSNKREFNHTLKVNYKENSAPGLQYEIYIDVFAVITRINLDKSLYPKFKVKLDDFIHQFVPANTRYLICLPDEGSWALAEYIIKLIGFRYAWENTPKIISQEECDLIKEHEEGAAVIVASCIANGKNLLYLSRALRRCDRLKLVYFIGVLRMSSQETLDFLKSNLKQGNYGGETNSFHAVESIYCNNEVANTPWVRELKFLKGFQDFAEEFSGDEDLETAINGRISLLEQSISSEKKGLANSLFYHSVFDSRELNLRKNYAFLNFGNYFQNVSQADVYFTISCILNALKSSTDSEQHIIQSEYVRTLLDPGNFTRFNDGIIQASILRGASKQDLSYHIDQEASSEMRGILATIVTYQKSEQGEALIEFLYAIAEKRMSLKDDHLASIVNLVEDKVSDKLALLFCDFIKRNILPEYFRHRTLVQENADLRSKVQELQSENRRLRLPPDVK